MTDDISKELKIGVERAVRPLWATAARKHRIREELLAHVTAIFDEELENHHDASVALRRAQERFGDPRQLTRQLQRTVPLWNRIAHLGDVGSLSRPGESFLRVAGRITLLTLAANAVMPLVVLPIVHFAGRPDDFPFTARVLLSIATLNIPLMIGFILLTDGMYCALFREPSRRSWRSAAVCSLISLPFFPAIAFAWMFLITGNLAASVAQLPLACCFAPAAPLLFALLASQAVKFMRREEEWASIELDA
jgi:hypothetical protein